MPSVLNTNLNTYDGMVVAIRQLQAYLSRPVSSQIDPQGLGPEIIKLQTYLSTVVAGGQPSGFKFDPAKVRKAVADYDLAGSIIQLQTAADLT